MKIKKVGEHPLRTKYGEFNLYGFTFGKNNEPVIVLKSIPQKWSLPFLLRVQFACLNSTAFSSIDCDCARQLNYSMKISKNKPGVIIYFPEREAYNLGLTKKIEIMEKEESLGLSFSVVAERMDIQIDYEETLNIIPILLKKIKVGLSVKLISNSIHKINTLKNLGLKIDKTIPTPRY